MKFFILSMLFFTAEALHAKNCPEYEQLSADYSINTDQKEIKNYKQNGQQLIDSSFQKRIELHFGLTDLNNDCKTKLQNLFTTMRMREDYIGALFYKTPQIPAESVDYKKAPAPILEGQPYPYHLADQKEKFEFISGDIIITKGTSFVSSTISEVMIPKSVFSHIVFIHVDSATNVTESMESYIGHGVSRFSISEALKDENVRILVLRMKDQTLAKAASEYMYKRIKQSEINKNPIPYDYDLNFVDNSRMSCEEIAYDSLKTISKNNFIIPENSSTVYLKDQDFLKDVGLKSGKMMVPADMEIDSRFNIVLDWTDYKVIRDSERKDAVSGEMFRWMNEHHYKIQKSFKSKIAGVIWATRYIPGIWHLLSKISGIPTDYKKDVPAAAITTMASINEIGKNMLDHVTIFDEEFNRINSRWMTSAELRSNLNDYRLSHPHELDKIFSPRQSQ
ncbi:MAG: hypothetical protein H7336_13765 [Bacteriovorax sp.]|nr:hypothetical protein [Bacteriovorax sp.]